MLDFKNKNVCVTGGSRGVGLATALAFAKLGANVAITYAKDTAAAESAQRAIEQLGVKSLVLKADTFEEEAHAEFLRHIATTWGSLDVAIANAGIWRGAKIEEMAITDFREMMDVNMTGSFVLAKHAARLMKAQKSGSIVLVSSTAGQRGEAEHSHYAASKGALISFTKSLAGELAPFGIRVNCVAPGWVQTDMTAATLNDPRKRQGVLDAIPLGRPAEADEIANAILFLASNLASFVTGEVLNVNGGAVLCG